MSSLLIKNATIITPTQVVQKGFVLIEGSKVRDVERGKPPSTGEKTIDASGKILVPGLGLAEDNVAFDVE